MQKTFTDTEILDYLSERHRRKTLGNKTLRELVIEKLNQRNFEFKLESGKQDRNGQFSIPGTLTEIIEFNEAWREFVSSRTKKKKPLTSRAGNIILRRLSENPDMALRAIDTMLEKGWTTFQWNWIDITSNNNYARGEVPSKKWEL